MYTVFQVKIQNYVCTRKYFQFLVQLLNSLVIQQTVTREVVQGNYLCCWNSVGLHWDCDVCWDCTGIVMYVEGVLGL